MIVNLNTVEIEVLFRQDPSTSEDGGFQNFLVSLQEKVNTKTGAIDLTASDLERISRYAFNYGNGGWEDRLVNTFGRSLGPTLGR